MDVQMGRRTARIPPEIADQLGVIDGLVATIDGRDAMLSYDRSLSINSGADNYIVVADSNNVGRDSGRVSGDQ